MPEPRSTLRYRERTAHPTLRPYVECLWMASDPRRRSDRAPDRIVPDGCPELIVQLGDPFRRHIGARWRRQPRAFLAGTLSRPWIIRGGPKLRTLGVRFRPGAITSFFPFHMARATDRELPLADLMGDAPAREFVRRVRGADRRGQALAAAEEWLLGRAPRGRPARNDLTRRMVSAILRTHGRQRIDLLASSLGTHRRRIERAFARDLGIRPKLFSRIVRLSAALATLGKADGVRAVDHALEAGYFDQAHLARDFRAVAGRPARRHRGDGEMGRHFIEPDRLLAYLAGE